MFLFSPCASWRDGEAEAAKILIKTVNIQGWFNGNGPFGTGARIGGGGRDAMNKQTTWKPTKNPEVDISGKVSVNRRERN